MRSIPFHDIQAYPIFQRGLSLAVLPYAAQRQIPREPTKHRRRSCPDKSYKSMSLKVWLPGLLAESGREARVGHRPPGGGFAVHSKKYSNQRWSKSTMRRERPQNLYRLGIVSMGILVIPWTLFAVESCTRPHDPTHTSYSSNTTY